MVIEKKGELNGKPMYIGTYKGLIEVGTSRMGVINGLLYSIDWK